MQILLIFSVLWLLTPAQNDSKVVWLGPVEIDMGEIRYKEPVLVRFPFRNVSEAPLTIDNIRTGCGCTAPDWADEPVMPGDTSSVIIRYDAEKAGYYKQWIRVYLRGQRKPERLWVKGEVVQ
jgi:hypothetical protein